MSFDVPPTPPPERDFRVGRFLVQPALNRIVAPDGERHSLNPKAMEVLVFLARYPGEVLSKDRILAEVWGDAHVGEGVLTNAVYELRSAFGESARNARLVVTIPRKGYRLKATVEEVAETPAGGSAEQVTTPPTVPETEVGRAHGRRRRWWLATAGGLLVTVVATAFLLAPRWRAWNDVRLGTRALEGRQYDRAITLLRRAIQRDPTYIPAYDPLANAYDISGNEKLALEVIEQAFEHEQEMDRVERLTLLRREAQIEEDTATEFQLLKELILLQPQRAEWHHTLGWFYATHERDCGKSLERHRDAIRHARRPTPQHYAYFGEALLKCGRPEEALAAFERHVELQPDAAAHDLLAHALILTGRYREAEGALDRALELDPQHSTLVLGKLHFARGSYRRAWEMFDSYRIHSERPSVEATGYWHLARVRLAQDRADEAVENARKALKLKPDAAPALWVLGLAHVRRGDLPAAALAERIRELRDGTDSLRGMEYYHHLRGRTAQARGELDRALGEYRRALELYPEDRAFFQHAVAELLAAQGDLDGAEEAYRRVFAFNPEHAPSRCGLARVHAERGQRRAAASEYRRCLGVLGENNWEEPLASEARRWLAGNAATSPPSRRRMEIPSRAGKLETSQ